jgi:uncharacterized membrane protein
MKETIAEVLKRYQDRQVNLASEAARNLLASEIEAAILSRPTATPEPMNLVDQYNRNRPIEEHIKDIKDIK